MGRRIAACAALLTLLASLSACCCYPVMTGHEKGKRCMPSRDCTGCYDSEADDNVSRRNDDLPPGGPCWDCDDDAMGGDDHRSHGSHHGGHHGGHGADCPCGH